MQGQYEQIVARERVQLQNCLKRVQVREIEEIDPKLKYDRLSCSQCHYYQYISLFKCGECEKKYCLAHAHNCCGGGLKFMTRQPDRHRKGSLALVKQSLQ